MVRRNRLRYAVAVTLVVACSYAMDRCFFSGLVASKWIGLPQYEQAMKELQNESRNWGIAVIILESAALLLVLPPWPKKEADVTTWSSLPFSSQRNMWFEYLGRCSLRVGLCLLGTVGLAILISLTADFIAAAVHAK